MRQTGDPDMTQKILTMGHGGGWDEHLPLTLFPMEVNLTEIFEKEPEKQSPPG